MLVAGGRRLHRAAAVLQAAPAHGAAHLAALRALELARAAGHARPADLQPARRARSHLRPWYCSVARKQSMCRSSRARVCMNKRSGMPAVKLTSTGSSGFTSDGELLRTGAELMQSEPSDGSEKLQTVARVLRAFKSAYNQHRCLPAQVTEHRADCRQREEYYHRPQMSLQACASDSFEHCQNMDSAPRRSSDPQ